MLLTGITEAKFIACIDFNVVLGLLTRPPACAPTHAGREKGRRSTREVPPLPPRARPSSPNPRKGSQNLAH